MKFGLGLVDYYVISIAIPMCQMKKITKPVRNIIILTGFLQFKTLQVPR